MEQARQTLERQLIEKAWSEEKFRSELMTDPKAAIEQLIGQALPQGINIKVIEETANTLYLIIPANPENLPDEMLDLVTGGGDGCSRDDQEDSSINYAWNKA